MKESEPLEVSEEELKPLPAIQGIELAEEELSPLVAPLPRPDHNQIRDLVRDIGEMEGKHAEVEYPIDNYRLDVAWKRIKTGIPSHVFEVHLSGDFFEALSKLKHAWDKWNSKPILVTTEEYANKARVLLEGSFHEIGHIAKIVNWKSVVKLHKLEREAQKIKTEIGI